jgi:predicted ribosome quality control (RQC) complex YloA/Tae2 family protein
LTSPAGCTIVVGRNRRGNEYLTFNMARGNDIWLQ